MTWKNMSADRMPAELAAKTTPSRARFRSRVKERIFAERTCDEEFVANGTTTGNGRTRPALSVWPPTRFDAAEIDSSFALGKT